MYNFFNSNFKVANIKKHPFTVVMSKGNSEQRRIMMNGLGANLLLVDQVDGKPGSVTENDKNAMQEFGENYAKNHPLDYFVNQFNNEFNILGHYQTTGPEVRS